MPNIHELQSAKAYAEWQARPDTPVIGLTPKPPQPQKQELTEAWGGNWTSLPNFAVFLEPIIGPQAIRLYVQLCRYLSPVNGKMTCTPSIERLCLDTGISDRSLRSALKWLECLCLIAIDRERRPFEYTLLPLNPRALLYYGNLQTRLGWQGNPISWEKRLPLTQSRAGLTASQVADRAALEHERATLAG